MARRHEKVALGPAGAEGVGRDADRQHGIGIGMAAAVHGAVAEPADRAVLARRGDDVVADGECLDGDVAAHRADQRAGGVAGALVGNFDRLGFLDVDHVLLAIDLRIDDEVELSLFDEGERLLHRGTPHTSKCASHNRLFLL